MRQFKIEHTFILEDLVIACVDSYTVLLLILRKGMDEITGVSCETCFASVSFGSLYAVVSTWTPAYRSASHSKFSSGT